MAQPKKTRRRLPSKDPHAAPTYTPGPPDSEDPNPDRDEVRRWAARIRKADKAYSKWEQKFRCSDLQDFWEGTQWLHQTTGADTGAYGLADEKYVINLCFPGVEVKIPTLLFFRPRIRVTLRPPFNSDPMSDAPARTELLENTGNTFIEDDRNSFQDETILALRDAFSRFGMVQIGYSADFLENPNFGKPVLDEDGKAYEDDSGPVLDTREKIPQKNTERVFIKRIPAKQFRVGLNSKNRLSRNDWCGYYEWVYTEDVKDDPAYSNTENLKSSGSVDKEDIGERYDHEIKSDTVDHRGMTKLWHIWDIRTGKRFTLADNHDHWLKAPESFPFLPFPEPLAFHPILDQFYPLPVMFNWLHPQMELNETREMQKIHRRRFYRRYTYREGNIDVSELRKLEDGGDGVYAKANVDNPLQPVPDAPLDSAISRNVPQSKQDFYEISATSGEQMSVANSETATQASIIDTRSRIRESYMRYQVANFLGQAVTLILYTMAEYMTEEFWVKKNIDPLSPDAKTQEQTIAYVYQRLKAEDLGELNYEIKVDVESLSPVSEDLKRSQWTSALQAIFGSPITIAVFAASAVLLKKTLAMYDIRDARDVQEIQKALQMIVQQQQEQQQAMLAAKTGGAPPSPQSPSAVRPDSAMAAILAKVASAVPGAPATPS